MTRAALLSMVWRGAFMFLPGAQALAESLACPAGSRLEVKENAAPAGRREWCVDTKSGLKEGPERELRADGSVLALGSNQAGEHHGVAGMYDEKGMLTVEMTFERGDIKSMRLTLAGVTEFVADMNRRFVDRKIPAQLRVIDEHAIGVDFRFADANAVTGAEKLAQFREYVRGGFCELFDNAGTQLQTMPVRVFNDVAVEPQLETELRRADCAAAGK